MKPFLSKEDLNTWLEALRQERTLVGPVKEEGVKLFRPLQRADEIVLETGTTDLSPKGWLFPPSEVLFTYRRVDGQAAITPTHMEREAILFGLRPCDAQGIALLDLPYLAEPADALYAEKRQKTALVGVACREACPECFCTSLGGGPQDATHLDILLTQVEGGYLAQAVTEKGRGLLSTARLGEREADPPPPPTPQAVPVEGIMEVAPRVFNDKFWDRLADRCIHCNVCSYVCPVCYCFDIRDYTVKGGAVERVRSWESCQAAGFTRLAGGYNPRGAKGARMRQRFYHKLFYQPKQFGRIGCTGCGRCVRACPVNIDIREIIATMQKIGARVATGVQA